MPHIFRTTLETIPDDVPYQNVAPLARQSHDFQLGVVWAAGEWDERRSVPYELLEPLCKVPGVSLHVIQQGPRRGDWREGFGVLAKERDPYEQAQFLRSLDLLITIDSMPAHLAGALGVPVWTLLQHEPDWRWMSRGDRSPWYPTMRLFRQPRPGCWEPVITRVANALVHAARTALRQRTDRHGVSLHSAS
jgi:hypothetical protein